MYYFRQNQMA